MDFAAEPTAIEDRLGRAGGRAGWPDSWLCPCERPVVCLPIWTRSAALLTLLLDDGAIDLELVSSVVALDPGLALGTLQLANPADRGQEETTWMFPPAVVAAGRKNMLDLINCAPKLETDFGCATSASLRQLFLRSVQRACVAEFLSRALGAANPKQSYLAGLLSGLTSAVTVIHPRSARLSQTGLQAALRDSLPPDVFDALCESDEASHEWSRSALSAAVRIANALLEAGPHETAGRFSNLISSPLWAAWGETTLEQRHLLVGGGRMVANWVASNAQRLAPWEFAARLRRRKTWD